MIKNRMNKKGEYILMKINNNAKARIANNKGITLIALVVTIVILIILATISINAVLGENGIIKKAEKAKDTHEQGVISEEEAMNTLIAKYENATNENGGGAEGLPEITPTTPAGTQVKKPSAWDSTKVIAISDGSGNAIPLPDGFYYVGGNRTGGLVISDKAGDTMDATGVDMGNQFVWIPATEADLERTNFDDNGHPTNSIDAAYTEPYASGYSDGSGTQEASEYNTMRIQVLKYGGFYIGRFEAGVNTTTLRTSTTEAQTVVCKRGVAPYNWVPWGVNLRDIGDAASPSGAVYLAKKMYQSSESVTSTLCYGCQWDAMCRYIGDSKGEITELKEGPELTGSVSTDVSKNIYDLAGNCYEWTMETYGTVSRVLRAGGYNSLGAPISNRNSARPDGYYDYGSMRPTFYIK